jgi:hypothetical protein
MLSYLMRGDSVLRSPLSTSKTVDHMAYVRVYVLIVSVSVSVSATHTRASSDSVVSGRGQGEGGGEEGTRLLLLRVITHNPNPSRTSDR